MGDLPLFSVISMVRNRAGLIRNCVESVLAQDDPAVEFVVQDGASTDGTLEILREYGDRIRLVSEPDAGAGDALFGALRRARGEFWGSCLSDERLVPDAVSWARRTFAAHPGLGAIYGYAEGVDGRGARLSRQDFGEFSLEDLLTYRQVPPFVASFFRMAAYRQVGLWDYTGGGEHDLWFRFAVRFPIRRFAKLVACYGMDRSTLSNQSAIYQSERPSRLEALRRLFHDDPAGRPYQHLEALAFAGYFLRYAGMFVRIGEWDLAAESFHQACAYRPEFTDDWLEDGDARVTLLERALTEASSTDGAERLAKSDVVEASRPARPADLKAHTTFCNAHLRALLSHVRSPSPTSCAEGLRFEPPASVHLRTNWLHYTIDQPFNVWRVVSAMGIRRVALFGGDGWGLAVHRQLAAAGLACVAVIDNNASTRQAAVVPARYFSLPEYLASRPTVDAVLSGLQGDHDRDLLSALQGELGPAVPVISWKMLFAVLSETARPEGRALQLM